MFLNVSLFLIVLPWPLSEVAIGDKRSADSGQEETVEERIRRVENGLKDADAQFTFVRDEVGKVVRVNIRRSTREFKAKKNK
ncbi:MAG TPA: hypothetical protein VFR80_13205 [Pyrinomonadaceae bacterium]|nr:hypothetical protein [Pyrinomonadaceae bacterium]